MATVSVPKLDIAALSQKLQGQFRGLNPNDPSSWPTLPRIALNIALVAGVVVALWFVWISGSANELDEEQVKETKLRDEYTKKITQAVNLDALKKQREQVQQYVTQLEKQLPSKAEMDALLSDINQAGLGRSLHFELFEPGSASVKDYYAELPIKLRVTGRYHDIGWFASDIAHLSRIVTLNNMTIQPLQGPGAAAGSGGQGMLQLEATAKTFRYLDPEEVAAQRKATTAAKPAEKKK